MNRKSLRVVILLITGLVVSLRWWELTSGEEFLIVYAFILALLLVLYPIVSYWEGRFDPFEIMNVFLLMYFLNYFLGAWLVLSADHVSSLTAYIDGSVWGQGLFLTTEGLALFYLGYLSPLAARFGRHFPRIKPHFHVSRAVAIFIVVVILGVGFRLLHAHLRGGFNILMSHLLESRARTDIGFGWMSPFMYAGLWGIPLGFVYLFRVRDATGTLVPRRAIYLLGSLALITLMAIRMGRGMVLGWMLIIIVSMYYCGDLRLTRRFAFSLAGWVCLLMIGIYWLRIWLAGAEVEGLLEGLLRRVFVETFSNFEILLTVLSQYPTNYQYFYGATILDAFLLPWIPRALWPTKKLAYGGLEITEQYAGWFASAGSSTPADMLGELYANFGEVGVVGMFLHGVIARSIYLQLVGSPASRNKAQSLLYGMVVVATPYWTRMGFSLYVPTLVDQFLPATLALMWIHLGLQGRRRVCA